MSNKKTIISLVIVSFAFGVFLGTRGETIKNNRENFVSNNEESGDFLKNSVVVEADDLTAASNRNRKTKSATPVVAGAQTTEYFEGTNSLEEVGSISESANSKWWVNSGGRLVFNKGVGSTITGDLPSSDSWYKEYLRTNPLDTDNGAHPQNIFRLVEKEMWKNYQQQAYFKVLKINLSQSSNRNASNGILLFNRYQSGDNLYYTGVRVDGAVVIKKKYNGVYYTMAYTKVFPGVYDQTKSPNLIPINTWLGLRSEVKDMSDGSVSIKLYMDKGKTGVWTEVLSATDVPGIFGSAVISNSGYAGIRTDFMDLSMDDYLIASF